jgi:mannose-6-phosphate isomerase-like protein (cupin superfamily)
MQKLHISPDSGFRVVAGSALSQRAIMVLAPGQSTRGPYNRHASSDQWLLVLAGTGEASIAGRTVELTANTSLLIEAGEAEC